MSFFNNVLNVTKVCGVTLLMASCVTPSPTTAPIDQGPKTPATKTLTSFTPALRCMDRLLDAHGKVGIGITTAGIPDSTGKVRAGTKDMLINSINKMVVQSQAFEYVDYDSTQIDLNVLFADVQSVAADRPLPQYYIRGAITQLDDNVQDSAVGAVVALPFLDVGASKDQSVSMVSLDMSVGDTIRRTILPGVSTSNSIAVVRSGKGIDAGGQIEKAGFSFNLNLGKAEGLHSAVRTLIELSLVEVLGKLTNVPYWKCLDIDKTNPEMKQNAHDWYDKMEANERLLLVQEKLASLGYYNGATDGQYGAQTQSAISEFQAKNGLVPNGRVNFDLYYALLDNDKTLVKSGQGANKASSTVAASDNLYLNLTTDRGQRPIYSAGNFFSVLVSPTQNSHVYCYYQDANKRVLRIFPNRFQENSYVPARQTIQIPAEDTPFRIRLDKSGVKETISCFASKKDMSEALDAHFAKGDLTPLGEGVDTMNGFLKMYQQANPGGIASAVLSARVK